MPYINLDRSYEICPDHKGTIASAPKNPGELNYLFTVIAQAYFYNTTKNYQAINDIIGALEGAKLELYRRLAAPYEDRKIKENGDVYHDVNERI
jgi:hypothetical protein